MQSRVPAVLLPRCFPRREQLIRAERMQAAGLAQCVETLEAGAVRDAVKQALGGDVVSGAVPSMTGAEMMAGVVVEMAMGRRAGRALAQ
jgi:predicted glycosyltransferase